MKRFLVVVATAMVVALAPTAASAMVIEIGAQPSAPLIAPACPVGVTQANCTIVLTQVTAMETIRAGVKNPTLITKPGELVAFTLGISGISSKPATLKSDEQFLDSTYGGGPEAALTVLRPVGKRSRSGWAVAAESPDVPLQAFLGQVVQFPLFQPLPVIPGEIVALTVPTWAPVLTFGLTPTQYAYQQSRTAKCGSQPSGTQAQVMLGQRASYGCNYTGTRVEYTATEITTP